MKIRILVIDDALDICKLIQAGLKAVADVDFFTNPLDFMHSEVKSRYDIVFVDLMMPNVTGFELIGYLKSKPQYESSHLIVVSSKVDTNSKITAYNLGAINYIEKPFDIKLLRALVQSLSSHRSSISNFKIQNFELNIQNHSLTYKGNPIPLTASQFQVFCCLLERANSIVSRDRILDNLSANSLEVTDRIVDSHISSIRKKMIDTNVEIKAIYKQGYTLSFKREG